MPIENSLESYHILTLHLKTFGEMPEEQNCCHDLQPNWTTFRTPELDKLATRVEAWIVRRLRLPQTRTYVHHHAHPHLTFASLDVMRLAQMVLPTSPTTCVHRVWLYVPRSLNWNPLTWPLARMLSWIVKLVARRVIHEDVPIFAEAQHGLDASPFQGIIGTREERVHAFQEYVLRHCARATAMGGRRWKWSRMGSRQGDFPRLEIPRICTVTVSAAATARAFCPSCRRSPCSLPCRFGARTPPGP